MNSPAVSVLMTAYNREKYIADAIESVLASGFEDFELIIVDDKSSDRTVEIAREYENRDSRISVHVNEGNLGDYPNRNRAASLAKGKYLKYVDSDDYLYPYALEFMVSCMERFPNAAFGACLLASPRRPRPFPFELSPEASYAEHFLNGGLFVNSPTASIIHRERFEAQGRFATDRYVGDGKTWLKLAANYPMIILPNDMIWWRQHPDQEYAIGVGDLGYLELDYVVGNEALNAPGCPLKNGDHDLALQFLKHRHARSLLRLAFANQRPLEALKIIQKTEFALKDMKFAISNPLKKGRRR